MPLCNVCLKQMALAHNTNSVKNARTPEPQVYISIFALFSFLLIDIYQYMLFRILIFQLRIMMNFKAGGLTTHSVILNYKVRTARNRDVNAVFGN